MAQPTAYTRQYNFNDFATTSPSDPLPGVQVDNELNSVKTNLDGVNANIALIQRDDGKLANQSVHKNSFDTDALALIGLSGYTVSGTWSASQSYTAGTLVDFNAATYLATVSHTSGTVFATDLTAGKWILLANAAINTSGSAVDKFEGTGSQTQFTLSYSYSSTTDFLVFVNGALRNPNDDYTLSGTTLTLATPPSTPSVSGNENVIVWGASVTAQSAKDAAATSASNASGFATAASNSAAAALASQTAAAGSASSASTDAGTASTDAGTATTQAGIATTQAGTATTQAGIATTQAGTATTQAGIATTKAGEALSHKNDAETAKTASEAAKSASESARDAAQTAQAAAEAALDTFDDRFLGAKSSDPSVDNDGNTLIDGALYFDTTNDIMKVYDLTNTQWRQLTLTSTNQNNVNAVAGQISPTNNIATVAGSITNVNTVASNLASVNNFGEVYRIASSAPTTSLDLGDLYFDTTSDTLKVYGASGWQNAGSSVNGTSQRYHYDITGTPTSVTGADANGNTLAYDAGYVDVYVNGVRMSTADVTVTSGDTVAFTSALAAGDEVDIVGYGTFSVSSLNADNLDSGTVPSARVTGAYTGITSVGTLTSFASTGIDDNASSTAVTINASGKVGLGIDPSTLPSFISHAMKIANGGGLSITSPSSGDNRYIFFGTGTSSADVQLAAIKNSSSELMFLGASGSEKMRIDSAGNVGIGISSPTTGKLVINSTQTGTEKQLVLRDSTNGWTRKIGVDTSNNLGFFDGDTEAMRITSGGDLLVNTTTDTSGGFSIQTISNNTTSTRILAHGFSVRNNWGTATNLGNGIFSPGGSVLAFSTASTERTRIIDTGFFKTGNLGGTYRSATATYHEMLTDKSGDGVTTFSMTNASYQGGGLQVVATRAAAGDTYRFFEGYSANAADREFRVDSDGTVHADGSYTGTGADYAEMFEWSDGNTTNEDRVGKTVVLDGNQIRLSTSDDAQSSIIGVVSARPVVLGDAHDEKWIDKYETDDFGRHIREEYTQTEWIEEDEDGNKSHKSYETDKIPSDVTVPSDAIVTSMEVDGTTPLTRRKLNSSYDSSQTYIPREQRKEFSPIGLVGKLRVTVGQTVGDRWIKMREISDTVHEYLVR